MTDMKRLPKVVKDRCYYLRMFRATYDFDQYQAAMFFDVSPAHWSLIERGKRTPSPEVAAHLAKVLRVPIEVFLNVEVTR